MSYDVSNIISINTRIQPSGLGFANFATAVMFAPESELPSGFLPDTTRTYNSLTDLSVDFPDTTETYQAMNRWLGGIPATSEVIVWGRADADATWTASLNKARNELWWFWSFFTAAVYADVSVVDEIATWHNSNESYFMNCQTGTNAAEVRDPNDSADIATTLTTAGYRYASTFTHATDPYAGISVCKWFAAVNYTAANSTITGEYKKLSGVAAEDLTATEHGAMEQDTKKASWYGTVDLQGSTDIGRVLNLLSHSSFGEYMDDVINLAAFVNNLKVNLYNAITNATTKLPQTPAGQAVLITAARQICELYISNGYLGPRNYTDPDDGVDKFTLGYEILTDPEDILDLTDPQRDARESAPLSIRIFRAGAIHSAAVDIDVY